MRKFTLRVVSVVMSVVVLSIAFTINGSALTASQIRDNISDLESQSKRLEKEIKQLQGKINAQEELKSALEQKIAVVQKQINICNAEMNKINGAISKNNAEIKKNNQQIEADKLEYKKRLRAIYMSNTGSNLQILLGADDFSEFLQLAQLTKSVSSRDKKLIEELVENIKRLEEKQKENEKLLQEQVEIKKIVSEKQQQLMSENNAIQSVINGIDADQSKLESANKNIENQIKAYRNTLNSMTSTNGTSFVYDGGDFLWPVPGYYNISAGFQSNDAVHRGHHNGIDIAGGGISGKPIIAISDGVVTRSNNSCPHNYKKNGSCGCGGGYGNYVTINHGTKDGKTYVVTYGHMSSTAVGSGATVKKGQVIGYVGTTGWSTGYHLHFGISVNGVWRNPMNYYSRG